MDGEDGADIPVERIVLVDRPDICGNEARGPVVAMDDVGLPPESLEDFENAAAEEDKPLVVVRVILLRVRVNVQSRPSEQVRVVEEIRLHLDLVVDDERRLDAGQVGFRTHRDLDVLQADHLMELRSPFVDASVTGHHHADLVLVLLDGLREGT